MCVCESSDSCCVSNDTMFPYNSATYHSQSCGSHMTHSTPCWLVCGSAASQQLLTVTVGCHSQSQAASSPSTPPPSLPSLVFLLHLPLLLMYLRPSTPLTPPLLTDSNCGCCCCCCLCVSSAVNASNTGGQEPLFPPQEALPLCLPRARRTNIKLTYCLTSNLWRHTGWKCLAGK